MALQAGTQAGRDFSYRTESIENGLLVMCKGRLVAGATSGFLADVKMMFRPDQRIVLDLCDVTHLDSSGLGALVQVLVSSRSAGCRLQLYNLSRPVKQLFGITHLLNAFENCGAYLTKMP
ncbi:MAG TPA: STAS domain-containing protein [Terriglobales bacterium]|nr:STAS domain-containing protein [Terriglobales bacterium]